MGLTDVLCDYIYSSFQKLKKAIEKIEKICKEYIKKLIKVADGIKNVIRLTISDVVKKINQSIEDIRKNIKPLLIDGPGKIPILCDDMWNCLALLQELLDSGSAFYKSIKKNVLNQCVSESQKNIADHLSDLIGDYTKFRDIICNSSFGIEFSIDAIKLSLKTFKLSAINYNKLLGKKLKILNGQLDTYLHIVMDQGLCDFLNALIRFFNCAFGTNFSEFDNEINIDLNPCAEISTAQNFFNDVLASVHLIQVGDTYKLDPEFKASIISTIEAMKAICQDVIDNIDQLNQIMVNPTEVKVGFKGYENSAHVFPSQSSGRDNKNTWNSTVSAVNGIKTGQWTSKKMYKKYLTNSDTIVNAFYEKKTKKTTSLKAKPSKTVYIGLNQKNSGNKYSRSWILSHTFIDDEGNVYVKDGCDYILLDNLPKYTPADVSNYTPVIDYMTDGSDISNDETIVDPDTGELINQTEASIRISEDPNSGLAVRCKQIWSTINNMYNEQNIVRKY